MLDTRLSGITSFLQLTSDRTASQIQPPHPQVLTTIEGPRLTCATSDSMSTWLSQLATTASAASIPSRAGGGGATSPRPPPPRPPMAALPPFPSHPLLLDPHGKTVSPSQPLGCLLPCSPPLRVPPHHDLFTMAGKGPARSPSPAEGKNVFLLFAIK